MALSCSEILHSASQHLNSLVGYKFDVLTISKPNSIEAAINLSKIISKLSPLIGNLIEFNTVDFLNSIDTYKEIGFWKRQDPDFPDALFVSDTVRPSPGFEIKAWFPFATEITARFKDSQKYFLEEQTNVCLLAWLPEYLIYGMPQILDVCVVSGSSVAKARDSHYHNPPDYLIIEPEDTRSRTKNLQQTNTNGYKWQGSERDFLAAKRYVDSWALGREYSLSQDYQSLIKQLINKYTYRLDTNFAKLDRIGHSGIEAFKERVFAKCVYTKTVKDWNKIFSSDDTSVREEAFKHILG